MKFAILALIVQCMAFVLGACSAPEPDTWQGYVEGEFVYVASPLGGRLETLQVTRGHQVEAGAPLFRLEADLERAKLAEAREGLRKAQNSLADLGKGSRPSEKAAIRARLTKAQASVRLARTEYERRRRLFNEDTISAEERDRSRTEYALARQQVREIEAELTTAALGGRKDALLAAKAEMDAAHARVDQAQWNLDQKTQSAPAAALIFDTVQEPGEWVGPGAPVVVLLPPQNRMVRFFVPQARVGGLQAGQAVTITYDGATAPIAATVSYVSPEAEYTPPVIYSSTMRSKLVFLIEARPTSMDDARRLPVGLPVTVSLQGAPN